MERRIRVVLLSAALVAGCGAKPPAPAPRTAVAQTPSRPEVQEEPAPSHDPFEQPDAPVDLKALQEEMRHDCCTELPQSEIDKHRQHP